MASATATLVSEWTFALFALAFLVARVWVRFRVTKLGLLPEDILLMVAQLLFFIWIACDTFTITTGFMDNGANYLSGHISEHVRGGPEKEVTVLKVVYASSVPYYLCIWFIKGALLGFYYRLIPKKTKSRIFLHVSTGFTCTMLVVIILLNLFLCVPIRLNWDLPPFERQCYSSTSRTPFAISAVANLSTDILIFIVPFAIIPSMGSIPRGQLYGLIATFSLGIVTMAVFVARAIIAGISGSIAIGGILSAVECCTAMIVACLPALKALLKVNKLGGGGGLQKRGSEVSDLDVDHHMRQSMDDEEAHRRGSEHYMGGGGALGHYEDRARHHHDMMMMSTSSPGGHEKSLSSYSSNQFQSPSLSHVASKTALRGGHEQVNEIHPNDTSDDDIDGDIDDEFTSAHHLSQYSGGGAGSTSDWRSNLGRAQSTSNRSNHRHDSVELDILQSHYQQHNEQHGNYHHSVHPGDQDTVTSLLSSARHTVGSPANNASASQMTLLGNGDRLPAAMPSLPPLPKSPPPAMAPASTASTTATAGPTSAQLQQQIQQLQWQQDLLQRQQDQLMALQRQQNLAAVAGENETSIDLGSPPPPPPPAPEGLDHNPFHGMHH